jgi:Retroviral aspartyl protease
MAKLLFQQIACCHSGDSRQRSGKRQLSVVKRGAIDIATVTPLGVGNTTRLGYMNKIQNSNSKVVIQQRVNKGSNIGAKNSFRVGQTVVRKNYGALLEFQGTVCGHTVSVLVDDGATGDFISTTLVRKTKLNIKKVGSKEVQVALKGDHPRPKCSEATETELVLGGLVEQRYFDIVDLDHYDVILGMPWHEDHNPIIDWKRKTISIQQEDQGDALLVRWPKAPIPDPDAEGWRFNPHCDHSV